MDDEELRMIQEQVTHDYESPAKGPPKSCAVSEIRDRSHEKARGHNGGQDVVDFGESAKAYDD